MSPSQQKRFVSTPVDEGNGAGGPGSVSLDRAGRISIAERDAALGQVGSGMERSAGERVGDLTQLVGGSASGREVTDRDGNLRLRVEQRCSSEPAVRGALLRRDVERMLERFLFGLIARPGEAEHLGAVHSAARS